MALWIENGEEEPGGREEQRTNGDGRRRVYKRQALWRSLLLKTFLRRDQDSLFCKKVKVSLYTFDFCFVNCCNTSQFMLFIGSRLLKLLVTWATNKLDIIKIKFWIQKCPTRKTLPSLAPASWESTLWVRHTAST